MSLAERFVAFPVRFHQSADTITVSERRTTAVRLRRVSNDRMYVKLTIQEMEAASIQLWLWCSCDSGTKPGSTTQPCAAR